MSEYYGEKKLQDTLKNPMQPIRAGTASGVRANNPHPYEVSLAKARKTHTLRTGFEPAREYPIGFQVQRLNHSAIAADSNESSCIVY